MANAELLSILMPVYNESRTLRSIVSSVMAVDYGIPFEVICVDDGSQDDSPRILEELSEEFPHLRFVVLPENRGKGHAIRTAIGNAEGTIAVVQDADLEYDPTEIPLVIGPLLSGKADAVYGSRFASSPQRRVLMFWHSLGNRVLTTLSNMANDLNLTDMETCYKAVRLDVLRKLRLTSNRFGIEPEITARLAQYGARIYEVPISYHGRTYAEGKNIGWRDGVQAIWLIFKFRFLDTQAVASTATQTQRSLVSATAFRRWVLDRFGAWPAGDVLEIAPGPGHTTKLLLGAERLVSVDTEIEFVETLERRFGHLENVGFVHVDQYTDLSDVVGGSFDDVVCLEVLQRVEDEAKLLEAVWHTLAPGGRAIVQVPARPPEFGESDRQLGHRRRFDSGGVMKLMEAAGFVDVEVRDFNKLGRIGWEAHARLGRSAITRREAWLFNLMMPLVRVFERFGPGTGLSLAVSARRPL